MNHKLSPFDYKNEFSFLSDWMESQKRWGELSRIAKAASIERSHLSRVCRGQMTLNPDQTLRLGTVLGLADLDLEYFLLLSHRTRAATPALKMHLDKKMRELKSQKDELQNRVHKTVAKIDDLTQEHLAYYGSMIRMSVHLATSIASLRTPAAVAQALGISTHEVEGHLKALAAMDYVEKTAKGWKFKQGGIHLPRNHPVVQVHHQNWRWEALRNASKDSKESVHFTAVNSLSAEDAEKLRSEILKWVETYSRQIEPSNPEQLACLCIDYFRVDQARE